MHQHGGKICIQLLHAGRYGYHPFSVAPSAVQSPITPFKPKALSDSQIRSTIADFAHSAKLAKKAGYDGVEIMGSEGYLIKPVPLSSVPISAPINGAVVLKTVAVLSLKS